MVIRTTIHSFYVDIGTGATGKTLEEVRNQLRLQVSHETRAHLGVNSECGPSAKIDGRNSERLIHGHDEIASTKDAALITKRTIKSFTKCDANVFNGMVLIDVKITITFEFEIKSSVARKQFKHVIKETNTGSDFVLAAPFNGKADSDPCFSGVALESCGSRRLICGCVLCLHFVTPHFRLGV